MNNVTISQKNIRTEKWEAAKYELGLLLDNIPMTVSQRNDLDSYLRDLQEVFEKANF